MKRFNCNILIWDRGLLVSLIFLKEKASSPRVHLYQRWMGYTCQTWNLDKIKLLKDTRSCFKWCGSSVLRHDILVWNVTDASSWSRTVPDKTSLCLFVFNLPWKRTLSVTIIVDNCANLISTTQVVSTCQPLKGSENYLHTRALNSTKVRRLRIFRKTTDSLSHLLSFLKIRHISYHNVIG